MPEPINLMQDPEPTSIKMQRIMQDEERKRALAAGKDPNAGALFKNDFATPQLTELGRRYPQLLDPMAQTQVPDNIRVQAAELMALREAQERIQFQNLVANNVMTGTKPVEEPTYLARPGEAPSDVGAVRWRKIAEERAFRSQMASQVGESVMGMASAMAGAPSRMPRLQTAPTMMGVQKGQPMPPSDWNRPGSQMGAWWESLPTAAQQGMNVAGRQAKAEGRVPMVTPEGPISLSGMTRTSKPTSTPPLIAGSMRQISSASSSDANKVLGQRDAGNISETPPGVVSSLTVPTGRPNPTEIAAPSDPYAGMSRKDLSRALQEAMSANNLEAAAIIKDRLKSLSLATPKGERPSPVPAESKPQINLAPEYEPGKPFYSPLNQALGKFNPSETHTPTEWISILDKQYPGKIPPAERAYIKANFDPNKSYTSTELTHDYGDNRLRVITSRQDPGLRTASMRYGTFLYGVDEVPIPRETPNWKGRKIEERWPLGKPELMRRNEFSLYVYDSNNVLDDSQSWAEGKDNWVDEHKFYREWFEQSDISGRQAYSRGTLKPYKWDPTAPEGIINPLMRVRAHRESNQDDTDTVVVSEIQSEMGDNVDEKSVPSLAKYELAIGAAYNEAVIQNNKRGKPRITQIDLISPADVTEVQTRQRAERIMNLDGARVRFPDAFYTEYGYPRALEDDYQQPSEVAKTNKVNVVLKNGRKINVSLNQFTRQEMNQLATDFYRSRQKPGDPNSTTVTISKPGAKIYRMYETKIYPAIRSWAKRNNIRYEEFVDPDNEGLTPERKGIRIFVPKNAKPQTMPTGKIGLTKNDRSDALA